MKRIVLCAGLALLAALPLAPATAGHGGDSITYGPHTIISAAPGTKRYTILGITEGQGPCGRPSPDLGDVNGVDGYWLMLPVGEDESPYVGHTATLVHDQPDMDVWFYDAGCGFINDDDVPDAYELATDLDGGMETGRIPEGAQWMIVDQAIGVMGTFTLTVTGDSGN